MPRANFTVILVCLLAVLPPSSVSAKTDPRAEHENALVLDTHLDTPQHFGRPGWSILERHGAGTDASQVDLPRMAEGGLDGGFWVIFTDQGPLTNSAYATARNKALQRAVQIREMAASSGGTLKLTFSSREAAEVAASGGRIVFQSIENSYPLGEDLTLLETFYELGVRMVGPVHSSHNQFADSATDTRPLWGGLSPLGRQLVDEANRLGIILDASHASDAAFDQMLERSKTPIILSHSGVKALSSHARNIDDARLRKLAAKGGVIHLPAVSAFLIETKQDPRRVAEWNRLTLALAEADEQEAAAIAKQLRQLNDKYPAPQATLDDFMASLFHAIKIAGVDHVGIGLDWDGGADVAGLEDVAALPNVTERLMQAGLSRKDVRKILGGNVMRVLAHVEKHRQQSAARK